MRTSELNEIRKLPLQKRMYLIEKTILSINLDPVIGAEMKKTRPAVIVSDNFFGKLPLKIIVPITDWKDRYNFAPWMVNLIPDIQNGLSKDSSADCFPNSVNIKRAICKTAWKNSLF